MLSPVKALAAKSNANLEAVTDLAETAGERIDHVKHSTREDAQEIIDDEYQPLIDNPERRNVPKLDADETRVRAVEITFTYIFFTVMGSIILLPWNGIICTLPYFALRLQGSKYQDSFASWISVVFCSGNLVFMAYANLTQQGADIQKRASLSIIGIFASLLTLAITTRFEEIPSNIFFPLMMALCVTSSCAASILQNAVVALSSMFGPHYLQGILSGQGIIGVAVSAVQFLSALGSIRREKSTPDNSSPLFLLQREDNDINDYAHGIRKSAFIFFILSLVFTFASFVAHIILTRLPFYRIKVKASVGPSEDDDPKGTHKKRDLLLSAARKSRTLGGSVFLVFFLTLSVFPSVTSTILSVNTGSIIFSPPLFVPLSFIVFNVGDLIGKSLPSMNMFVFKKKSWLVLASVARIGFIPLILACNVQDGNDKKPLFPSDSVYIIILLIFAISNGYVSTLIMIAGVSNPALEKEEVDLAATALSFAIVCGLTFGALTSFGIRGLLCHCNPFLASS